MHRLIQKLFLGGVPVEEGIHAMNARRQALATVDDDTLRAAANQCHTLIESIAVTAVAAERVLGLRMFDVQLQGSLALARGRITEMQTGEGKTLASGNCVVCEATKVST